MATTVQTTTTSGGGYRYKTVDTYFGTSFYTLDTTAARPLIKRKKVILKNDYIHHVVDIYHL